MDEGLAAWLMVDRHGLEGMSPPVPDWYADAACADVDTALFFPEGHDGRAVEAKAVCEGCPVRVQCLDFALDTGQPAGVWGGMTTGQRDKLRRQRQAA